MKSTDGSVLKVEVQNVKESSKKEQGVGKEDFVLINLPRGVFPVAAMYPFKIVGGRLYRCRVFETEKSGYIFFDVHHSVFDGTSLKILMEDVAKVAAGTQPDTDYYYLMLQNRQDALSSRFYDESRKYFEDRYHSLRKDYKKRQETKNVSCRIFLKSEQLISYVQAAN